MHSLIAQMGYIVIATPDLEAAAEDLVDILGLRISGRFDDRILLSSNSRSCEVAFVHSHYRGIRAVGLEAPDVAAVDEIARRVTSEGCTILDDKPSIPRVKRAVRFRSLFGPILEVHTPVARESLKPMNDPGVHARRLDHVNIRVSDPHAFHEFTTKVLGMRLSDRTDDYSRAWYRAGDGFHHTIAAGPGEGLHHYGFDAYSILDLAAVADGLVLKGRSLLWGVGRHGPGNNIFSYYIDTNDTVVETSFGMERLDENPRDAGVWTDSALARVFDVWGSTPPSHYSSALTPFVV